MTIVSPKSGMLKIEKYYAHKTVTKFKEYYKNKLSRDMRTNNVAVVTRNLRSATALA